MSLHLGCFEDFDFDGGSNALALSIGCELYETSRFSTRSGDVAVITVGPEWEAETIWNNLYTQEMVLSTESEHNIFLMLSSIFIATVRPHYICFPAPIERLADETFDLLETKNLSQVTYVHLASRSSSSSSSLTYVQHQQNVFNRALLKLRVSSSGDVETSPTSNSG
ncbi:hypothetical protein SCHPADRAFT_893150 [Schizopora paradoxa]|uniref:Uncharacterized protein n=1 Tax=Schizopora paradoxa TaxID=27342 RepID=A0A0H2RC51_9AGAM|nr:hypothetical protein SCHPADRAFT_893150 [Schizopora paradoxa]